MSAPTTASRASLMGLPVELQDLVLFHCFAGRTVHMQRHGVSAVGTTLGGHKPLQNPLFHVSKYLREKAIVEFLRRSKLRFDDTRDLSWASHELQTLFTPSIHLAEQTRRVVIRLNTPADTAFYVDFLKQCVNLKDVTLQCGGVAWPTVGQVRAAFNLQRVEELSGLKNFDIYFLLLPTNAVMMQVRDGLRLIVLQ